jgi:hypothetical protein
MDGRPVGGLDVGHMRLFQSLMRWPFIAEWVNVVVDGEERREKREERREKREERREKREERRE